MTAAGSAGEAVTPGPSHVVVSSPNKPRPDDPWFLAIADTLRRIEVNYDREGSGPGSRFEGELLEDVQARTAIAMVRAQQAEAEAAIAAQQPQGAPWDGLTQMHLTIPDTTPPRREQPAPELAAAMAETRELRQLVREICDQLVSQKYPPARVAPWLKRAGLPS